MSVYRVFNSSDLTSLFYRVYLCFLLDLRRSNNKHNCIFQLFHFVYLIKKCSVFIFKMFYHISFKLNIVNFSKALPPPVSPLNPSRNSQPRTTLHFISQFIQNADFFPSWLTLWSHIVKQFITVSCLTLVVPTVYSNSCLISPVLQFCLEMLEMYILKCQEVVHILTLIF